MPNEHKPLDNIFLFIFEKLIKYFNFFKILLKMSVSPIIVIFAYNRPKHLNNSYLLNLNKIQTNQKILFFCDGPKSTSDKKINQIKEIIKSSKLKF